MFGQFVAVLFEFEFSVDDSFALLFVQFEVVLFVVPADFEQKLFALFTKISKYL